MVLGKSWINRNSFPDNRWASRQPSWSLGGLNRNSDGLGNYPDGSGTSENGPGRSWKCSRRFRNVPKRSRKVPEGSGRFRKVPEGSGQYHSLPHAPSLGGKPPRLPQVVQGVGGTKYGRNPTPSRIAILLGGGFPGGKDSLWE